jgi:hypothetical protein
MHPSHWLTRWTVVIASAIGSELSMSQARADVITDWNVKAGEIVTEAKIGTPPANRASGFEAPL